MKNDKNDAEFDEHYQEGLKRFQSGKFAESLEEFFVAAQIDSTSSDIHFYIGEALEKHKQQLLEEDLPTPRATMPSNRATGNYQRATQAIESTVESEPAKGGKRAVSRYQTRIPIIVVAYDSQGKFFAELAMTRTTSVKGAAIEMQRRLKLGAQIMLFTIDSRNAVPAQVRNLQLDNKRARYNVGVEFLKGPIDWLVPTQST
jgi:tetratricopeptide (TPR) repeat protein